MKTKYRILILGASYGSLLATKLVLAGHDATMVCLPHEAELFNRKGAVILMPIKGTSELVRIDTREASGQLAAAGPADVDPHRFDLVALAMQEPQYRSPDVRGLLDRIGEARIPCMSIMNMPPLAYLRRITGLDADALRSAFTDADVWDAIDPSLMTLCSPDPQAFRPPEEEVNVLQVRLPTNFKAARFESDGPTQILRRLQSSIEGIRFDAGAGRALELPVKLKVHDSIFVPLAKWSMLIAGNYRCVEPAGVRSIREAVHGDVELSRRVYEGVSRICMSLGASDGDLVPFDKYAAAAQSLGSPSSAARALAAGACDIERVDRLVFLIATQKGLAFDELRRICEIVDGRLQANRTARAASQAQPVA